MGDLLPLPGPVQGVVDILRRLGTEDDLLDLARPAVFVRVGVVELEKEQGARDGEIVLAGRHGVSGIGRIGGGLLPWAQ
jgi:hypothetical protein